MLAEDFEDELTCPVCLMLFTDPRTLPCGNSHNVCLDCARGLWRNPTTVGHGNSIQCPVCRATCNVSGGIDRLPLNLALKNMVEKLESAQKNKGVNRKSFPPKRKLKCDVCEKKPASMECVTCVVKYCDACLDTCHPKDRAVFKAHMVVPMEIVSSRECDVHSGQALSFFCTECGVAVCAHCLLMGAHIEHPRVSLQCAVKEKKTSLMGAAEMLKGDRAVVLDFSGKAERAVLGLQHQCKELRTMVGTDCSELQLELQALQRKLISAIDMEEKEKIESLEHQIEGQRQKLNAWSAMLDRADQIAQEEDGAVFLEIDTLKLERQIRAAVDAASIPPPLSPGDLQVNLTLNMAPLYETVTSMHFTEFLVPAAPTGLSCVESDSTCALLTWRLESVRDTPTTFILEQACIIEAPPPAADWSEVYRGSERSFAAGGLSAQASYRFRVCAINSCGASGWSEEAVVCMGPPVPPADLLVLETSDRALILAWPGEPASRTQHCRYTVEMLSAPDDPASHSAHSKDGNVGGDGDWREVYSGVMRTCMVTNLTPSRTYSFRVHATNNVGTSAYSPVRPVTTLPNSPSGGPVLSRASPPGGGGARGAWLADEDGNNVEYGEQMLEQSINAPGDVEDDGGVGENAESNASIVDERQP